MTLKQQIKDAKLLLGLNPGCRIVCKRKKVKTKTEVKVPVMTSLEKTKGLIDEELGKAERANYIIRTEKPRVFERSGEATKVEKTEKEILKSVEDIIKREVDDLLKVKKSENKILKDVETQTINEIQQEFKEEKEGKEDEVRKLKIENEIFRDAANAANDALHRTQKDLSNQKDLKNILSNRLKSIRSDEKDKEREIERDRDETKESLLKLQNEINNAEDELRFEIESRNGRSHKASELRGLIKALKEEEKEFLQEEILGPRSSSSSSSSSTQLDRFIGSGKIGTGMTDQEIDTIMKDEPNYQNCISADEIHTLKPHKKMEFIINTDVKSGPGKHWCACFIDVDGEKEIDYYDPLADDPTERFRHDIQKYVIDKLDPQTLLKFKINKVIDQRSDTDTCGLMCINFLRKRNRGVSFKEATGYKEPHINKTKQFEKEATEIRRSAGFGYI